MYDKSCKVLFLRTSHCLSWIHVYNKSDMLNYIWEEVSFISLQSFRRMPVILHSSFIYIQLKMYFIFLTTFVGKISELGKFSFFIVFPQNTLKTNFWLIINTLVLLLTKPMFLGIFPYWPLLKIFLYLLSS